MKLTQRQIKRIIKEELEKALNENLPDCPTNTMKVQDLFAAATIAAATEEEKKELYALASTTGEDSVLKKISNSLNIFGKKKARVEKLGNVAKVAGLLAATAVALGFAFPAIPVVGAMVLGTGGATTAGTAAGAALIGTLTDIVAGTLMGKEEKKLFNNDNAKQLMKLFCIDMKLLTLLDNKVQAQFIKESDLNAEIKNFFTSAAPTTELPDLNSVLINWLNSKGLDRTAIQPK